MPSAVTVWCCQAGASVVVRATRSSSSGTFTLAERHLRGYRLSLLVRGYEGMARCAGGACGRATTIPCKPWNGRSCMELMHGTFMPQGNQHS